MTGHRALVADAWGRRFATLSRALGAPTPPPGALDREALARALGTLIDPVDPALVWLTLATLTATFPTDTVVAEATHVARISGGQSLAEWVSSGTDPGTAHWDVKIIDKILVDVDHTMSVPFTTGIQRVARESVSRWLGHADCVPVGWTPGHGALRELTAAEIARITKPVRHHDPFDRKGPCTVLVPHGATYILPELAAEVDRTTRLRSLARFAQCRTGVIGFDCVPITSAETTAAGMSTFALNLAAVRHFDVVAAISNAAAKEYRGWRQSLSGLGVRGPQVEPVLLPVQVPDSTPESMAKARERFVVPGLALVLVVGSHEPRKNHLAVLHAAEILWREGHQFNLSFVGGRGWKSEEFYHRVKELTSEGRPVEAATGISDEVLNAAYRLARFTVFPSLNEGFGLPAAESLACGTPVITSNFGSMHEIAADGGALEVDPRDDHAIAGAMRALFVDDALHARLAAAARERPARTWDMYAAGVWDLLTGPTPSD